MNKRLLDRQEYTEYILLSDKEHGQNSPFREPGEFLRYMMSRSLSSCPKCDAKELLAESEKFARGLSSDTLDTARKTVGQVISVIDYEISTLTSLPDVEPGNRDRLEKTIAETQKIDSFLDNSGEIFGRISAELFREAGMIEDKITELSLALESERRRAIAELGALLPNDRMTAEYPAPSPFDVFGKRFEEFSDVLSLIDSARNGLLSRLSAVNRRAAAFCRMSVYLINTARFTFPAALGRMAIAAGVAGLEKDGSYEFERADAIATLTSLCFKLRGELNSSEK